MAKPFLSVIIPAYNEADRLPMTLIDVDRHLSQAEYSYEILVVNDGSIDATAEITRRFAGLIKNLKLIDNPDNRGKGAVVKLGMMSAKGNIRLFMDADNSTSIIEFNKMLPYFKEGFDIVIGSRAVKGARMKPAQPALKRLAGRLGNFFIQLVLLKGIWDSQCGFKAFTEEAAEKIFSLVQISRWGFDAEVLALARWMGYKIKEMPVFWVNHPKTHVRFSSYFQVLWETLKIRWWLKRDVYKLKNKS